MSAVLCAPVTPIERTGGYMRTYTGLEFYPLAPRAEDVNIIDIAVALSRMCRFGGHTNEFYSVAQHSVYVSYEVPPEHALTALMHDATEAYCVDVPRPIKRHLTNYKEIEDGIWQAIALQFDLPATLPECVHYADNSVLLAEKEQLLYRGGGTWSHIEAVPANIQITPWSPNLACSRFIDRFTELDQLRQPDPVERLLQAGIFK
jgi:uncharacterized protein